MSQPPPTDFSVRAPAPPLKSKKNPRKVLFLVVTGLSFVAGSYWWLHRGLESTDDAQVDAEVVPLPVRIGGIVAEVLFEENQIVKAGQVLARLDDALPSARVAQSEAALLAAEAAAEAAEADATISGTNATSNLAFASAGLRTAADGSSTAQSQISEAEAVLSGAEAAYRQAELDRKRAEELLQAGTLSQSAFDQTNTAFTVTSANLRAANARLVTLRASASQAKSRILEASAKVKQTQGVDVIVRQAEARAKVARAQVETARAALLMARLELSYTRVTAPVDGIASKKTVLVGQNLAMGQAIAQLVTPKRWVTANLKETQLTQMRVGQPVKLEVDAFPGRTFRGRVESFADGTGSRFALIPPDNASGNFTKVVQRVPVRIAFTEPLNDLQLRPGMNVELTVDTRRH